MLALAVMLGVINAFDMPGRQALVVEMTSQEDLINAISLNSAVFNAARVIGPAEIDEEFLRSLAVEKVQPLLEGKTIRKIIIVPRKMVNIVVS